jgi:adenylate kinase
MVCSVVETRLRREVPDAGLILDGFPRTVKQATFLDGLLSRLGISRPTVVHLHVSYQGLLRRLTARRHCAACGAVYNLISRPSLRGSRCERDGGPLVEREDDAEEVIRRRLAEFDHMSVPLIEYYRGSDYHPMDGDRDPDIIARDLLEIVQGRQLCVSVA